MKVLHLSASDVLGGAAKAAYRLHRALINSGIDSYMFVQNKLIDDKTVIGPKNSFDKFLTTLNLLLERLPNFVCKKRSELSFSLSWAPFSYILRKIDAIDPDIVHLHWVCDGMLNIDDILKINRPVVWSMHDMWAFTGGCHYDNMCNSYKLKCSVCEFCLTKFMWSKKEKVYSKKDIAFIALSSWLYKCAAESFLLSGKFTVHLPNLIDVELFKPINREYAREILKLPLDCKLILFGSVNPEGNPRKGFREFIYALKGLRLSNYKVVIFGTYGMDVDIDSEVLYMGYIFDDTTLALLYNAVDVTVVPSLQENLSNTIMESLSCGTPVVAFNTGGNKDMIDHKVNGYLAKCFDHRDLAAGINWVLCNSHYFTLREKARDKIVRNFDSRIVVGSYINFYKKILSNNKSF